MSVVRYLRDVGNVVFGLKSSNGSITHPSQLDNTGYGFSSNLSSSTVMRISTVYSANKVLCDAMATFPIECYSGIKGNRQQNFDHWLPQLLKKPCRGLTLASWQWYLQHCLNMRGVAYCLKVKSRGRPVELMPLNPDKVKTERNKLGERVFKYTDKNGRTTDHTEEDIWMLMGATVDGINGAGPVRMAMETFETADRAQRLASNSLKNGAAIGMAVSVAGKLRPETREALKQDYREKFQGPENAGNLMLLEEGGKIEKLSMTMEEFQFLESRAFSRTEIAALFGVPPHRVGDNSKSSFTIEQHGTEFKVYTMSPIAVFWEQAYDSLQEGFREKVTVRHNMDGLTRGDTVKRYMSYASGIGNGWLTRNEARLDDDRNPLPGLDEPLVPMNSQGDRPGRPNSDRTDPQDDDEEDE